jgi:hypothetical protein
LKSNGTIEQQAIASPAAGIAPNSKLKYHNIVQFNAFYTAIPVERFAIA